MDDYLAKPFSRAALHVALARWLAPKSQPALQPESPALDSATKVSSVAMAGPRRGQRPRPRHAECVARPPGTRTEGHAESHRGALPVGFPRARRHHRARHRTKARPPIWHALPTPGAPTTATSAPMGWHGSAASSRIGPGKGTSPPPASCSANCERFTPACARNCSSSCGDPHERADARHPCADRGR